MSRECPTCKPIRCCEADLLQYEVTSGTVYFNAQQSVDFVCPPGFSCTPGIYSTPQGRFRLVVNENPTEPTLLRLQCCEGEIIRSVTPEMSAAEIGSIAQEMVNNCAIQSARCQGEQSVIRVFRNIPQCANTCPPPKVIGYTGSAPVIGGGYTVVNGQLCIAGGIYSSSFSQAQANQAARTAVINKANQLISATTLKCGFWNTVQICPGDPPVIIEAFTFFSEVSQADADALALDSCVICSSGATCHVIDYTDAMFDNPGQNGALVGTFQFTNVQSPFLGSSWYTGHVLPNDIGTWTAMQNASAVTTGGNVTRLGNLEGGPGPGGVPYSQCGFGLCNNAETIFDQIGQTLSFYSGATTRPGLFTNPWDGEFVMTGGAGECGAYSAPQCVGIAGQVNVTMVITDSNPHVITFAAGATVIWEGSSVDLLGPYTRTSGTSAIPADLSIEIIS